MLFFSAGLRRFKFVYHNTPVLGRQGPYGVKNKLADLGHFFKIDLIVFQFYRPVHDIASLGGTWTYEIYDRYVFEWLQHTAPYVWSTLDRMFGFS